MAASQRPSTRGSRTLLLSAALVLLLGATGLLAGHHASTSAQSVHKQDRLSLQTTLAGLVGQYPLTVGGSLRDALAAQVVEGKGPWPTGVPGAAAGRLSELTRTAPTFDVGAVLVDGQGTPVASTGTSLPAPTDTGWAPLRAAVTSGKRTLPVSGMLDAGGRPATAVAIPVPLDDGTTGLVVGVFRMDRSPLQRYATGLRYGATGHGWIVDANGRVVAGPAAGVTGKPFPFAAQWAAIKAAKSSHGVLDGKEVFTSYAAAGDSGWTGVTVQDHDEFLGDLERTGRIAETALFAMLLIGGSGLVLLNRRRLSTLQHDALRDSLTGVYNRRGWFAVATHELERARRAGETRSLLFVDVDGLKLVNDALGHDAGDQAILGTAQVLTGSCRSSDLVGRLGGDEFVLLLGAAEDAVGARRRIYDALATHNADLARAFELRISAGAETWTADDPCTIEELVRRADAAMYLDKAGRRHTGLRSAGPIRRPAALPA